MNNTTIKISAYTFVRNGIEMGYPFIESIQSAIDLVDEYIVVLGDSTDGSREALLQLNNYKLKIIDTVWDMNIRAGGKLFAIQSNIGLDNVFGDWVLHLQADEVLHEKDIQKLKDYIYLYNNHPKIEALLFPFLNFRGDYNHIHTGRQAHRFEIRAFKNNSLIRSYKDSQGFRKYSSLKGYRQDERGEKLKVAKIDVPVYHYNYVRPPKLMKAKTKVFHSLWHDDQWLETNLSKTIEFDYNEEVDKLEIFYGSHPSIMDQAIMRKDWHFIHDPSKHSLSLRYRILDKIEEWTGIRIGEYKNYKIV